MLPIEVSESSQMTSDTPLCKQIYLWTGTNPLPAVWVKHAPTFGPVGKRLLRTPILCAVVAVVAGAAVLNGKPIPITG